jgi:small ligand-binding sensory domain FIST
MHERASEHAMRWASAVSDTEATRAAALEAAAKVAEALEGRPPDIAFVFFSPHHRAAAADVAVAVAEALVPAHWIGCSAGGIIGAGHEIEERPGLSITAACLPGVNVRTFRLDQGDLPDADAPPRAWEAALGVAAADRPDFVVLADPFSFQTEELLHGLDYAYPDGAKTGGLASAAGGPSENALLVDGDMLRGGAIGVALSGAIVVDTVVAQGCRAIGHAYRVTRAHGNFIAELDGKSPLEVLRELLPALSDRDQRLARSALFLGVSTDPMRDEPDSGEYLIRNILGVSPDNGALAVGELPRVGQSVRFHLRDALSSAEDLDVRMDRYVEGLRATPAAPGPSGALLFSCLGRGQNLYGRPDHDTDAFRERMGDIPLGGFFAQGEIGRVKGATYLHGFTSSFAVFRAPGAGPGAASRTPGRAGRAS